MHDPWLYALSMLCGKLVLPAVTWPADRIRRVQVSEVDRGAVDEGDGPTEAELALLQLLERCGPMRAPSIAKALGISTQTAYVRLHRARTRGLLTHAPDGAWLRAAGGSPPC
jgi:hypothetical protein